MPAETDDPTLTDERHHLTLARRALHRMRSHAAALDAAAGGDWVSRQVLADTLAERLAALQDDPEVPLFFGRLDYGPGADLTPNETFHVGRRHISDEHGDAMVVDWRAPVSLPFYRAARGSNYGVRRRRRYGFSGGSMSSYEDEQLSANQSDHTAPDHGYSAIVEAEVEKPRVGPMRDIVATIQPEQDVIVRAELATSVCVQGAPGTGKTAVGLHRAAYLLYAHREQLTRRGVLVIGPSESFLGYIGHVLPALGEIHAKQTTLPALCLSTLTDLHPKAQVRASDSPEVAALKGDPRMAAVIERAVWSHLSPPTEGIVVPRGAARWRVSIVDVEDEVAGLRSRSVRYGAARAMLAQRLAHHVLLRMETSGHTTDDRLQDAVARSRPVKQFVDAHWPAVDPARLILRLTTDPEFLAECGDGYLSDAEQQVLLRPGARRAPGTAAWTSADLPLVDEAAALVSRQPSWGHVVVDEAQDLSAMALRAIGRRASTGSLTVLGDLAQTTTPWGVGSWAKTLEHLGQPNALVDELTRGFRVPGEVIDYAARLLPHIAPELTPPTSVRHSRGELKILPDRNRLSAEVHTALDSPGSVGLIVPDSRVQDFAQFDEARVQVVPAGLAKGLEFDHVIVVEPAEIVDSGLSRRIGLSLLYVCLTRAVTSLVILHDWPLPEELGS